MEPITIHLPTIVAKQEQFNETLAEYGYNVITTYYSQLTACEAIGIGPAEACAKMIGNTARKDYKLYSEFVLTLQYKSIELFGEEEPQADIMAEMYHSKWMEAEAWAEQALNEEQYRYFVQVTDLNLD